MSDPDYSDRELLSDLIEAGPVLPLVETEMCRACKGTGEIAGTGLYDRIDYLCGECNGTGRKP